MSLFWSLAGVAAIAVSAIWFIAIGFLILDIVKADFERTERLLVALAIAVVVLELAVSIGSLYLPSARAGVCAAVVSVALLGFARLGQVAKNLAAITAIRQHLSASERWLQTVMAIVLFIEAFAAMAPLTGSDALHYHFAGPGITLRDGLHPNWFLGRGFLTGLSHQLILAGLAVGSEKLAMGWIFLGGAATAFGTVNLSRRWTKGPLPYIAGLLFLLTPVTFWQITTAGAPDVWMAFFLLVAIIVIERAIKNPSLRYAFVAGIATGALAGAKYTGILLAGFLFIAFIAQIRRWSMSILFFFSAVITGCFPYVRNWLWTGDPVFPFLIRHLNPNRVNFTTLADILRDAGTGNHLGFWKMALFVFFAWFDPSNPGFWQILGPMVLCFLPLILLAVRWSSLWRIVFLVWLGGAISIGVTSGMTRFTWPLLPIALAACMAGVSELVVRRWRAAEFFSKAIIAAYLVACFAGFIVYDRNNLAVAAGLVSQESYLRSHAPDYQPSEFVNRELADKGNGGRVLVFFPHTYYVAVPYRFGLPSDSWAIDPSRLQSDDDWKRLFAQNNIRWIVRDETFPFALSQPLTRLEGEGVLTACGSGDAKNIVGNRIGGKTETEYLTLLCLKN